MTIIIGESEFRGGSPAENLAAVSAAEAECVAIQARADRVAEFSRAEFSRWESLHPDAGAAERVAARRRIHAPSRIARAAALAAWDSLYTAILPGGDNAPQA